MAALGVERGALVRVLAVGELSTRSNAGTNVSGKSSPRWNQRAIATRTRRSRRRRVQLELPGLERDLPLRPGAPRARRRVPRSADRDDGGEVPRRRPQHRGPTDIDHLDHVVACHACAIGDDLERVEVHADEVERLDAVCLELGDVIVAAATLVFGMDARVERLDAPAEHLGEARELLHAEDAGASASASAVAAPPLATSSNSEVGEASGEGQQQVMDQS